MSRIPNPSLSVHVASPANLRYALLDSLKSAAKTVVTDMVTFYNDRASKDIPGKLDGTWWEGGSMFMTMIQYWWLTGDSEFNSLIQEGMYWQKGDNDFFPSNYSQYLGNDDQVFWGLAAMTAAEFNFPEQSGQPSWLSLAQGVFNTQAPRWDTSSCHGGMRWQIWPYQSGYTTKNAISNGGLFQLSARLALYTKNTTYSEWAERIWDWSATTPLLKEKNWNIADSTTCASQCTDHGDWQWTYNYGTYISGAAYMYNYVRHTLFPAGDIRIQLTLSSDQRNSKVERRYRGSLWKLQPVLPDQGLRWRRRDHLIGDHLRTH